MNTNITYSQNYSQFQNFKATRVATTSNVLNNFQTEIKLFKIGKEDKTFLEKLKNKINYQELCTNLSVDLQKRWQKVFNYCISKATELGNTTYLAFHKDKPCGILTYGCDGNKILFDGVCSIPQANKKVPFTGQTLIYQLFKDASDKKAKTIELKAVADGPFDVVSKYKDLGFKADPTSGYYTNMRCNKYNIPEQLKRLQSEIVYQNCNHQKINLEPYID